MTTHNYTVNSAETTLTTERMGLVEQQPQTDVAAAVAALRAKLPEYENYWRYYDGDHPQIYTNKRLAEIFRDIDLTFNENWCAVIIDALCDRVTLRGARIKKKRAHGRFEQLWRDLAIESEFDAAVCGAFVTGEAMVIVWPDGDGGIDVYANDSRQCHVFYDEAQPKKKRYAAKWWVNSAEQTRYLTLYYADRLEHFACKDDGKNTTFDFKPIGEGAVQEHKLGIVPVFHFRPALRRVKSDLKNALPLQVGINKLVNDLMVSAEFAAFRQRYIISNASGLNTLTNSPNEIWEIPAGDGDGERSQVGQFEATELSNYIGAIDHLANALAAITRTPKHYFFSGDYLSGEALLTLEAPLMRKAQKRTDVFSPEWRSAIQFILKLAGESVKLSEIELTFDPPNTNLPITTSRTRFANTSAGIPITTLLRREGWNEGEIAQLIRDKAAESEMGSAEKPKGPVEMIDPSEKLHDSRKEPVE